MPTLADLLARVSFLAAMPAVVGVLVTAGLLVVSRDWRANVIALAVQYFFVALLMTRVVRLEIGAVKGLVGWLICLVFYVTGRQAGAFERSSSVEGSTSSRRWRRWVMSARASFSLLAVILVAVVTFIAALFVPLPQVPTDVRLACYLLGGLGLLLLGVQEGPLEVGFGLLTLLSGFDLFYVALEPSLVVAGLLGTLSFVIALAMAYLRTTQAAAGREGGTI